MKTNRIAFEKAKSPKQLRKEGWDAYDDKECPYPQGSREEKYWFEGYEEAFTAECFANMDAD